MKIIVATSNIGKVKEIKKILTDFEIIPYTDILSSIEIVEDGKTFQENAIIKSETIFKLLNDNDAIVLADDSGISIDALNGRPNIYSARYAGENATDHDNIKKVCLQLKEKNITTSNAYYTASIAITSHLGTLTTHGWMHGTVTTNPLGNYGFGYDPIFIPKFHQKTLAQLEDSIKQNISHRYKALMLAKKLIKSNF